MISFRNDYSEGAHPKILAALEQNNLTTTCGYSMDPFCDEARAAMGGGKPIVVIADTVKGKGVSFMENTVLWHYRTARGEEYDAALKELEAHRP